MFHKSHLVTTNNTKSHKRKKILVCKASQWQSLLCYILTLIEDFKSRKQLAAECQYLQAGKVLSNTPPPPTPTSQDNERKNAFANAGNNTTSQQKTPKTFICGKRDGCNR
jgi:hypothetical protein